MKQFIENPFGAPRVRGQQSGLGMGPWGTAIAAGAAVLGSLAFAGFEAANSLGEYGRPIKDAELRTGLTSKEVGQFGFAARMAGQDISIFERMMKGLSQATSDNSKEGEKAKATLKSLGVDLRDATGELKPTSRTFREYRCRPGQTAGRCAARCRSDGHLQKGRHRGHPGNRWSERNISSGRRNSGSAQPKKT